MRQWTPATDGPGFELPPILRSLEPFRDRLNVVSDLTLPLAYGDDASAGANHTRSSAVWLTCARPETGATPRLGIVRRSSRGAERSAKTRRCRRSSSRSRKAA